MKRIKYWHVKGKKKNDKHGQEIHETISDISA